MTAISMDRVAQLYRNTRAHLTEGIIPFWHERALDREHGGFLTNYDESGRPMGTPEKYLNTQARLVWWFSRLNRKYSVKKHAELARRGVDFLIANFWDEDFGGWRWKVQRNGSPIDCGKIVYGQSFAIYALSEYYLATGDKHGLHYASETFDLLQKHCADTLNGGYLENFEQDWTLASGGAGGGDRKTLDTHMHLMEAFTALYAASGREVHRRKLAEIVDVIARHMIDPRSKCGRNQFDLTFRPISALAISRTWNSERHGRTPARPADTTSYGHNLELLWLMHLALETIGADLRPYWELWSGIAQHALDHGVDWEHGGVYRDGTTEGAIVHDKEFWQQAEALVGFLDAYELFGEQRYLDAFENIWSFVESKMIVANVGEWRTLLDRAGHPLDGNLGNPWKVAYHTGRAMIECTERLERLKLDKSEAVA